MSGASSLTPETVPNVRISDAALGVERAGWDEYREAAMGKLLRDVESLIEMHDRYGDSLQKSYLYKATHALRDGIGWFDWARRRKA